MKISAIICCHNSRQDFINKVLVALEGQTLPKSDWELLLVDNGSVQPLAQWVRLAWHPNARIVREDSLGLAMARTRGILETKGDLLVFVDDDNVLEPDYLAECLNIGRDWPVLGIWGGSILPDFEVLPAPKLKPYLKGLALREVTSPQWSNVWNCQAAEPRGAGICVRREYASAYCRFFQTSELRVSGRTGGALTSGEDTEFAYLVCSMGMGMGVFPQLKLLHLIPKARLTDDYMIRLTEGLNYSSMLLFYKWGGAVPPSPFSPREIMRLLRHCLLPTTFENRMWFAGLRARIKVRKRIKAAPKVDAVAESQRVNLPGL